MKIDMPDIWQFETKVDVRITDLNYGNHLANQNFLAIAQEARLQYFLSHGLNELDFAGVSLIQADAAILFKGEAFYGDQLKIQVSAIREGNSSFNVYYRISQQDEKTLAHIRTAIVCYDYSAKKVVAIPQKVIDSGLFLSTF